MRRRTVLCLLAFVATGLRPRPVHGQTSCASTTSCSVGVVLRLPRPNVASLSISTAVTTLPSLTATALAAGFTEGAGPVITVKANAPHRVTLQAAQSSWSYAGTAATPTKPAADLQWSRIAGGPWQSSAASATLWPVTGELAPAAGGQSLALFYRATWTWTGSPPGTYSIPVNITLTSP